jgi:hypothetical protein
VVLVGGDIRRMKGRSQFDPSETSAAKFAVMHNWVFPTTGVVGCNPGIEGST